MGSGKSTIGKELSNKLNLDFYDSDNEIVKYAGLDVKSIFNIEGELGFRKIEEKIIYKLTQMKGIILSTGGGTIISKNNRNRLIFKGIVIYLQVSITKQVYRTYHDLYRPLLHKYGNITNHKTLNIYNILYKERNYLYNNIADYMIYTEQLSIKTIVREIICYISKDINISYANYQC